MLLLASSVCGLFKWRQFEPEVILLAVGWYLRFCLSYRTSRSCSLSGAWKETFALISPAVEDRVRASRLSPYMRESAVVDGDGVGKIQGLAGLSQRLRSRKAL